MHFFTSSDSQIITIFNNILEISVQNKKLRDLREREREKERERERERERESKRKCRPKITNSWTGVEKYIEENSTEDERRKV